jgi:D-arabinose 1-dehydrogenase-like Zn-dependent alcohol dehydrogenase
VPPPPRRVSVLAGLTPTSSARLDVNAIDVIHSGVSGNNGGFWGTVKELREVIALVESGQLTSIPIEVQPLAGINEVYARLKRGEVRGRAVIQPAA